MGFGKKLSGLGWRIAISPCVGVKSLAGRGGFGDSMTTVENTPVGTLIVDVFDGQSKKLVWRGTSTETLSSKPEKNERKLEKAVADMFKKFPPTQG